MTFPTLPPKQNPDVDEQFTEVASELLTQAEVRIDYMAKEADIPQKVLDTWSVPEGPFWLLTYIFEGRKFMLYRLVEYPERGRAGNVQPNPVLELGHMFDDFRVKHDYPTPEAFDKATYNDKEFSKTEQFYALMDEQIPAFKEVFGEEAYQRLFESEDDF